MKKNRWLFLTLAFVLIASIVLAACQPAVEEPAAEEPAAEEPAAEEPAAEEPAAEEVDEKVGGTLVYAVSAEPDTLDPAKTGAAVSDIIMNFLGCSLVTIDTEGNVVPYVAESWDVSEDGLTYTFHLRDDVMYHDGKSVTAQDFAWEYNRALDPETASPAAGPSLGNVESITALDDYTLEIKLGSANFPFLFSIGDAGYMQPVNQETFETMGADAFGRAPVGCGPYKLVSWDTGSGLTLERNPEFNWGPAGAWENTGPWYIENIEVRIIPEVATISAGLEAGEIHVAAITQSDKEYLETLDTLNIEGSLQPGLRPYVAINVTHYPFDDVNVRKAFNLAVNREAAVQVLAKGDAVVQYGPLSPAQIGYWDGVEEIGYGYDVEQANTLMEEAGFVKDDEGFYGKDGERISLTLYTLPIETWVKAAELVQQQYKEFGIELTIQQDDQGVLIPVILGGDYDITMFGMTYPEADILYLMFHSSQIGGFDYAMVNDPTLDEILERTRTETDPAARQEAVNEAQQYIVEQAYTIPMYAPINYTAISTSVMDYRFSDLRGLDLDSAYIAQ
jgi:peptide/nickel transport system substrate-binding protein